MPEGTAQPAAGCAPRHAASSGVSAFLPCPQSPPAAPAPGPRCLQQLHQPGVMGGPNQRIDVVLEDDEDVQFVKAGPQLPSTPGMGIR